MAAIELVALNSGHPLPFLSVETLCSFIMDDGPFSLPPDQSYAQQWGQMDMNSEIRFTQGMADLAQLNSNVQVCSISLYATACTKLVMRSRVGQFFAFLRPCLAAFCFSRAWHRSRLLPRFPRTPLGGASCKMVGQYLSHITTGFVEFGVPS